MRLNFLRSSHSAGLSYAILIYALAFILYSVARADELKYFSSEINYWEPNESPKVVEKSPEAAKVPMQKREQFAWEKYLDPKNPEFFKEGEYSPPEPFMEIVRNPSDANLKLWFAYIDKRNELYTRLESRIQEFGQGKTLGPLKPELHSRFQKIAKFDSDVKRYRFRFYFDSKCPHCKRMQQTMSQLVARGYLVEGIQVDTNDPMEAQLPFPVRRSQKAELTEKSVSSVPLLLVGDLKKKVVFRLSGYQSLPDVFSALSQNAAL